MSKINPKSYRFHAEVDRLIDVLAAHELTNRTAVIEMAIKEMAKSRKIKLKEAVIGNEAGKSVGL